MKRLYTLLLVAIAGFSAAFAQWNTNATPVTLIDGTGQGDYYGCSPKMARTADKKTWISWRIGGRKTVNGKERSAARIYLQLLDRDGVPQFSEPILVNDYVTYSWWSEYALAVASDGSAIVTVADGRAGESTLGDDDTQANTSSPAIYKIDQQGNFLWGLDGVEYRQYTDAMYTNAFVIGDDTYFIFHNVTYTEEDKAYAGTYIQRISSDGTEVWESPRKISEEASLQIKMIPSLGDDLLYFDMTTEGSRVQRMNKNLELVWSEPVIYDENAYGGYEMNHYRVVSDGNGGACVAFQRFMGQMAHNIRVQHINEDGSLGFGLSGLDAYNAEEYDHNYCSIAANPTTKEILVQFASDFETTGNVMHQKFSYDGDYLYDEKGLSIASKSDSFEYYFGLIGVGSLACGDWIAVYRDIASWAKESIIIRRYDKDGNRVWTRTIGREIAVSDAELIVEEEAIYLVYREDNKDKTPGVKIFRISVNGDYNVVYPDPTAIQSIGKTATGNSQYFDLNGRQLSQPQQGLNIVRKADGSVQKQIR